ncbi:hypothetical protein C7212DRAFT_325494, partial [Tuber magnatum]
ISLERYSTPFGTDSCLHSLPFIVWSFPSLSLCLPVFSHSLFPSLQFSPVHPSRPSCVALVIAPTRALAAHCILPLASHYTAYNPLPVVSEWLLAGCEGGFLRRRNRTQQHPHPSPSSLSHLRWLVGKPAGSTAIYLSG